MPHAFCVMVVVIVAWQYWRNFIDLTGMQKTTCLVLMWTAQNATTMNRKPLWILDAVQVFIYSKLILRSLDFELRSIEVIWRFSDHSPRIIVPPEQKPLAIWKSELMVYSTCLRKPVVCLQFILSLPFSSFSTSNKLLYVPFNMAVGSWGEKRVC